MSDKTAEYLKVKTTDVTPGSYTKQPKTHKFNEETHDLSTEFPTKGIISCRKTPTESLQDYVYFILNAGMKKIPSYFIIGMKKDL